MKLEKALHQVWPDFSIEQTADIVFQAGVYRLNGENGSGKSSFYKKVLLPALREDGGFYIVYLEQMMKGQYYALKAHAALSGWQSGLHSQKDCVDYLLYDLSKALERLQRSIFAIADETSCLNQVWEKLKALGQDFTLIYSSHLEEELTPDYQLELITKQSDGSVLYERTL